MALSVRLDPVLESRIEQETRRLGISKSEFVKDAIERVLGLKNPVDLLDHVRRAGPMRRPAASAQTGAGLKARLRAKRTA